MTLLLCTFAAIAATLVWYLVPARRELRLGILPLMFWGASLMWLVDAFMEYRELGADYFAPAAADMLNDAFLGASVIALGLVIWLVALLLRDPRHVLRARA